MNVIILAAGASLRMGSPKGLLRLANGQSWLERQCQVIVAAGLAQATLVLGDDYSAYVAAHQLSVGERTQVSGLDVLVVRNPNPARGPFSSLRCALTDEACFVLPIDTPAPDAAVWSALVAHADNMLAVIPVHAGRGGHPVLLAAELARRLQQVPLDAPDARLDMQLRALPEAEVARVSVDSAAVIENLNTPDAFARWNALPGIRPLFRY